jgi:cell division protein FtsB
MTSSRYVCLVRLPLAAILFLLVFMGIFSKRGYFDFRRMVRQNSELREKIERIQSQKVDLERQVIALRSEPAEQERVIRKVLGYVKPTETVIEFP